MTASEIVKSLSPGAREALTKVPGYPVAVGAKVETGALLADELRAAGVIGPRGGLSIKGAVVTDRLKAWAEAAL